MRAGLLVIVVACAGNTAPGSGSIEHTAGSATTNGSAAGSATSGSGSAEANGSASTTVAGDPAEPTAPQVECNFDRRVRCVHAFDNDKPYQPPPFIGCPRTLPPTTKNPMDAQSQFSAAETRAAWRTTPGVCCYVDFIARQCR